MDVLQVVEEAVVSGAAAAAKEQASAAVTGAVSSLWGVVRRVFGADPIARTAVEKLPEAPEAEVPVWREQLRVALAALPKSEVSELVAQARAVLALTEPEETAAGRYAVTVDLSNAQGVQYNQGGSGNIQNNTF